MQQDVVALVEQHTILESGELLPGFQADFVVVGMRDVHHTLHLGEKD